MHIYKIGENEYPSVTTILQCITSRDLIKWANIMGFKHRNIDDILEKSSRWGTMVHSHLREIVDPGKETPIRPKDQIERKDLDTVLDRFKKYVSLFRYETIETELQLVSDTLQYGGMLDWIVNINGFNMIIDFKTSKTYHLSHLLQLGGYLNLVNDRMSIKIDGGGILVCNQRICKLYPFNLEQMNVFGETFNNLAQYYHTVQKIDSASNKDFEAILTKP